MQLDSPAGTITVVSVHIKCTRFELPEARHQMDGLVRYLSAQGPHIIAGDIDAGTHAPNDSLEALIDHAGAGYLHNAWLGGDTSRTKNGHGINVDHFVTSPYIIVRDSSAVGIPPTADLTEAD